MRSWHRHDSDDEQSEVAVDGPEEVGAARDGQPPHVVACYIAGGGALTQPVTAGDDREEVSLKGDGDPALPGQSPTPSAMTCM